MAQVVSVPRQRRSRTSGQIEDDDRGASTTSSTLYPLEIFPITIETSKQNEKPDQPKDKDPESIAPNITKEVRTRSCKLVKIPDSLGF